jgi:hypothetical protein
MCDPAASSASTSQREGGQDITNLGCFVEVVPMERLVWASILFPGYRPAVFDDTPITASS